MTHLEHCTKAFWRLAEQACSCEAVAVTKLEHLHEGLLAIGKNKFDYEKP